jgi:hypothetical protein
MHSRYKRLEASFELTARQQDAVLAGHAPQPNVRTESDHGPIGAAAGMRLSQSHNVPDVNLDEFGCTHERMSE